MLLLLLLLLLLVVVVVTNFVIGLVRGNIFVNLGSFVGCLWQKLSLKTDSVLPPSFSAP